MATISDVARLAGVSISTVSHVVNGTKSVSDGTRARVESAIQDSGFAPHSFARALRAGRSESIGMVASDTTQHIFGQIITGVESAARRAKLTLLLANSGEDREQELQAVRALLDRRVDGLIVAPVADSDPAVLKACAAANVPVVIIDRISAPGVDQVGIENRAAMRAVTKHLIDAGHTDIVLVAGDQGVWTIQERILGFEQALREAGLPITPESILLTGRGLADGHEQVEELLRSDRRPSALVTSSGLLTVGALRAIRRVGLRIPDDIAFACFDEIANSEFMETQLTCVVHPTEFVARESMILLLNRIADPHSPTRTILTQPSLFHGQSCGCGGLVPLEFADGDRIDRQGAVPQ
jgi:LacI family transcriptional regulator